MSNRVPLILDGYSLKDQCSAAELTNGVFALVRARIAWREALSWPGPLVEPPRQISEDVPSPSIVLWELALKLRMGAQHARGAIQAGFLVYAAKLLTWSPRDEQLRDRFLCEAKYGNDYHGQWKYVRDATDCELTLSMLLELARYPVGARAVCDFQPLWDSFYDPSEGLVVAASILATRRPTLRGEKEIGRVLADFCGRLLSTVLLAEPSDSDGGRKGDLDRAAAFAEMITTRKVSAWDEKYYGKTLLNALELDSKREFPAHLPKDLSLFSTPVSPKQLSELRTWIAAALNPSASLPPAYTSRYRMETSQDFMHTKTEKMLKESQYKTKLAEKLGMDPAILLDKGNVINGVTISGNSKTIIPCAKCGTIGPEARCGRCKSNYYCSSDCQKKDWPNHKKDCVPISDDSKKEAMKLIKVVLQDESVLREGREMMAKLAI